MIVLGLDPASQSFGATLGDGAEAPFSTAWKFPDVAGDHGLQLSLLKQYLDAIFGRFQIGAVGYESPILVTKGRGRRYGDKLSTLRLLYPLGSFVEWYCHDVARVPYHEIQVAEAKKEITGRGHADKEEIARIAERCGVVLPKAGRLDASDSWAVWKCVLRSYAPERSLEWDKRIHSHRAGALL